MSRMVGRARGDRFRAAQHGGLAACLVVGAGVLAAAAAPVALGLLVAGSAVVFGLNSLAALEIRPTYT